MEFTLLWAAATGIGAAVVMANIEKRWNLIAAETAGVSDLILAAAVTGLVTGRLAAMMMAGTNPITHPGDIVIVRSGVDTGFASLGALAFVSVSSRRQLAGTIDALDQRRWPGWPAGMPGVSTGERVWVPPHPGHGRLPKTVATSPGIRSRSMPRSCFWQPLRSCCGGCAGESGPRERSAPRRSSWQERSDLSPNRCALRSARVQSAGT